MEQQTQKRKVGRPKKYEKAKIISIRLVGKELELLDYVLGKSNRKKELHKTFVTYLKNRKFYLEKEDVKKLFTDHIQKSVRQNKRLEPSQFGGVSMDFLYYSLASLYPDVYSNKCQVPINFLESYNIKRKEGETDIAFGRKIVESITEKFPPKIVISLKEKDYIEIALGMATAVLYDFWQRQGSEEAENAFIDKVLKSEWYISTKEKEP
jgi:hypothetical protein